MGRAGIKLKQSIGISEVNLQFQKPPRGFCGWKEGATECGLRSETVWPSRAQLFYQAGAREEADLSVA